jgi:hypothetical protein
LPQQSAFLLIQFPVEVFPQVLSVHLMVYNRWGQKVFETNDINKGWDGKFIGVPANLDVFVWY